MTEESVTLGRSGDSVYAVTFWPDGVARWDGVQADRLGAWQAACDPRWFARAWAFVEALPKPKTVSRPTLSLVVTSSSGDRTWSFGRKKREPDPVWSLAMVLDGMASRAKWFPHADDVDLTEWALRGVWLTFTHAGSRARALATRRGLVVIAGSIASTSTAPTLEPVYKRRREALHENGSFRLVGEHFVVGQHLLFDSPSAAASVLAGSNTNGRRTWLDPVGTRYADSALGDWH